MTVAVSSRPVRKFAVNGGGHAFTIVEMAITLVVIGLILGAVLVPLGTRLREQKYTEVRAQLAQIKEAIVTYAESTRTAPFVYKQGTDGHPQFFAGGRRYLPCPDIDGDGQEDRGFGIYTQNLADLGTEIDLDSLRDTVSHTQVVAGGTNRNVASLLTLTFNRISLQNDLSPDKSQDQARGLPAGHCMSDIGLVPHSTLGTTPADPWGNRFTYRVDPIFSNDILGFGPETRADTLDPRLPLTLSLSLADPYQGKLFYQGRLSVTKHNSTRREDYEQNDSLFYIDNLPVLICVDLKIDPSPTERRCDFEKASSATQRQSLGTTKAPRLLHQDHGLGRTAHRLYINSFNLRAAGAFVVVSHGENGWGGIPHVYGTNVVENQEKLMNCNQPGSLLEQSNTVTQLLCADSTIKVDAFRHGFYKLPRSTNPNDEFDDELAFMSGIELSGTMMRRGISLGPVWVPPQEL